jgi:hypothetical protein
LREVNTLFRILRHRMRDNYTPVNILEEAIAGCSLCSLAISSSPFAATHLRHKTDHSSVSGADMSEFLGAIHMWTSKEMQKWYDKASCAYTLQSTLGPPPAPTLTSSTDHLDIIEISTWWLARCLGEHKSCLVAQEQADATHHPARSLYIGTAPEYKDARLITNNQHDSNNVREYFVLSYCWGKKDFPRLIQATMSLFQEKINRRAYPQLFGKRSR